MNQQLKGAAITLVVGLIFVAFEVTLEVRTALAGTFILGMSAGLLLGDRMNRQKVPPPPPMQPL